MYRNRFIELDYKEYIELTNEEIKTIYDKIIRQWGAFLDQNDMNLELNRDYFVHTRNLFEIIKRCDKRALYFYIFHRLEQECEYKKIAILCFWINTLKPFMVVKEDSNIYNCPNEMFSLYLILATIEKIYKEVNPNKEFKYPSSKRLYEIVYDFKYCSLSREAMIAYVETLADTYGVGINYIIEKNSENV